MSLNTRKSLFSKKKKTPRTVRVIDENTPFQVTEAYKAARTNLMFMLNKNRKEANGNVAVFTGANQGEGKTTTCVNLALTVAQTGQRVLVIDADMRKPRLHKLFGIDAAPGLSDRLSGMCDESCVYEISCGNLFILPAGTTPPNPAELLGSSAMDEVIEQASKEFDVVFIDMPPVGLVTDAAVVCSKVAGAILVVSHKNTTTDEIRNAADLLTGVGGKVLGTILNGVERGATRYSRYQSYSKYGDPET